MEATIKILGNETRIYIDNLLHIYIADRIVGIQSYIHENKWYKIEIQTKNNTTTIEYDSKDKWLKILELLDKNI